VWLHHSEKKAEGREGTLGAGSERIRLTGE
jgi:hypothetical protein